MSGTISAKSFVYRIAYFIGNKQPETVHKCTLWWRFFGTLFIVLPVLITLAIFCAIAYCIVIAVICLFSLILGNAVALLFAGWLWIPKGFDLDHMKTGFYPGWVTFHGRRVWPIVIILPAFVLYLLIKLVTNPQTWQSVNHLTARIPSGWSFWIIAVLVGVPLLFLTLRAIGRSESWQHLGSSFKDWWDNKACPILEVTDLPVEQATKTETPTT